MQQLCPPHLAFIERHSQHTAGEPSSPGNSCRWTRQQERSTASHELNLPRCWRNASREKHFRVDIRPPVAATLYLQVDDSLENPRTLFTLVIGQRPFLFANTCKRQFAHAQLFYAVFDTPAAFLRRCMKSVKNLYGIQMLLGMVTGSTRPRAFLRFHGRI
jgi:hypothetical protein